MIELNSDNVQFYVDSLMIGVYFDQAITTDLLGMLCMDLEELFGFPFTFTYEPRSTGDTISFYADGTVYAVLHQS